MERMTAESGDALPPSTSIKSNINIQSNQIQLYHTKPKNENVEDGFSKTRTKPKIFKVANFIYVIDKKFDLAV
uniref:Uncharacterized protein n=1 Tax=Rhizophora mucronata TaxID=61149 RepID=A0A2P2NTD9_RHIMU